MDENRDYSEDRKSPRPRIGVMGAVLAVLGTVSAFLAGVNWNVILSQEGAAVAGATVGFIGAGVVLARAIQAAMEKKQ